MAVFAQLGFEDALEEAVDGEDAGVVGGMEEAHTEEGADEVGPGVALGDGGVGGEGGVDLAGEFAQPGEREGIRREEGGELEEGAGGGVEAEEGGPDGGGDFAKLSEDIAGSHAGFGFAAAGQIEAQLFQIVGNGYGVARFDAGVVLAEIDGGGFDGEGEAAECADDFAGGGFVGGGGEGGVGLVEADEFEGLVFGEVVDVDGEDGGAGGGEGGGGQTGGDEEAEGGFAGEEGEFGGGEEGGEIDVVEEEEGGAAGAQGGQDAAGGEGVVGFLEVGEGDVEVADEGGEGGGEAGAAFATDEPAATGEGGGLAEGEGEGQGCLADAADADHRDGGGRGGVEQVGAQEAKLVFAADEAVLRPAEIAAQGAVEGEEAEALGDVLGEAGEFGAGGGIFESLAAALAPGVEGHAEALAQVVFPLAEEVGVVRGVEAGDFDEPQAGGAGADLAVFQFALEPFLPFPAAGVGAEVGGGEQDDEEGGGAQGAVAADFPVVEVEDVGAVEEDLDVAAEEGPEVAFELGMEGADDAVDVVAVGVGEEDVGVGGGGGGRLGGRLLRISHDSRRVAE